MKTLDTILNYLFVFGLGTLVGGTWGVVQRAPVLEKIWDYCIAK